jgi:hypothetical protein
MDAFFTETHGAGVGIYICRVTMRCANTAVLLH